MDASKDHDALLDDFDHIEDIDKSEMDESEDTVPETATPHPTRQFDLSIWDCMNAYRPAIFWSLVVSTCVIMEGYDTVLMGNFMAYPSFAKKYGEWSERAQSYQVSAAWQAGLNNASTVGAFLGTILNGYLVPRFGMKQVTLGGLIVLSLFLTIVFFAPNVETLVLGSFLCGFPFGIFASCAPAYASEVLPLPLRVYFTSYTNMCWIIGQLIAALILAKLVKIESSWGFRIPFALQWIWPAFLIPILLFAPESPWHLVRCNRLAEAEQSLVRLQTNNARGIDSKQALEAIIHTNNLENSMDVGATYRDCFKGCERRRTIIACMAQAAQILSGSPFAYSSTYFYQQAGLSIGQTYWLNVFGIAIALVATLISWFWLMPSFGRREIFIWGLAAMTTVLSLIGVLNISSTTGMAQALLTVIWIFLFQLSVGQLGWALPAEIGSTRLRQKTVCLARDSYHLCAVVASIVQPYCMNPDAWDLKGYTGFLWGVTAFATTVWAYYGLPETKGRSFDELDVLFARGISARKFEGVIVDTAEGDFEGEGFELMPRASADSLSC